MQITIFLKGLKNGQKKFGESIATVVNSILLSFVYIIGVGVTSILAKILRKRFLELRLDKSKESYWEELNLNKEKMESYYRQF